jgi:hypothetical protein
MSNTYEFVPSRGLYLDPSSFLEVEKEGTCEVSHNIDISKNNLVQKRRGFLKRLNHLEDIKRVISYNNSLYFVSQEKLYKLVDWSPVLIAGSYSIKGDNPAFSIANNNLYISNDGMPVLKFDGEKVYNAGLQRPLDVTVTQTLSAGILKANTRVNYRVTFSYTDINNNKIVSEPSQLIQVTNDSVNNTTPVIVAGLASDIKEDMYYQIFRSSGSVDATVPALEDLQLVDEVKVTLADLALGYVEYTDTIPENLRQGFLYTNPAQEGISQANQQPPSCLVIESFKNHLFYANVTDKADLKFTLVSVATAVIGDTFTVFDGTNLRTYTARATENKANREFLLKTDGTLSVNLEVTARSLVACINSDINSSVTAYYLSSTSDLQGQVYIQAKTLNTPRISINSSFGENFSPAIPASGDTYFGLSTRRTNKVMFSKISEAEAVPSINFLEVGSRDEVILSLKALKDSIIVLTNKSVHRIGGDVSSEFFVRSVDLNTQCLAPRSAQVMEDNVIFISDRGVVAANENEVRVISGNIQNLILNAIQKSYIDTSCSFAYISESQYFLSMPRENSLNIEDLVTYVYSVQNNAWVTIDVTFKDAVYVDNKLVILAQDYRTIYQERKERVNSDFCDSNNNTLEVMGVIDDITIQVEWTFPDRIDAIRKGNDFVLVNKATRISGNLYELVLSYNINAIIGDTFFVDTAIQSKIVTSPMILSVIAENKTIQEAQLNFRNAESCTKAVFRFISDKSYSDYQSVESIKFFSSLGWGDEPWSEFAWGAPSLLERNYYTNPADSFRFLCDRNTVRAKWIQVEIIHEAIEAFELQAVSLLFKQTSVKKFNL